MIYYDIDKNYGKLFPKFEHNIHGIDRFYDWFEYCYGVRPYMNGLLKFEAEFEDDAPGLTLLLLECG